MACTTFADHRPPKELWPERVCSLGGLSYDKTLNLAAVLLDSHVEAGRSASTAIVFGDRRISYGELQSTVNRIGNGLRAQGVRPGNRVILRMPNRPEFVATWLAVQKIGAVCVSTMPMLRARELTYIIKDSEACVAVVAADLLGEMEQAAEAAAIPPTLISAGGGDQPGLGASGLTLDALIATTSDELDPHLADRDDLALIAYTSGSTGQPKGACHAPIDVLASADTYGRHVMGVTRDDVCGGHPTLACTYGLGGGLVFPFRAGASTVLLDRFTPERLLDTATHARVTLLFCGATTYKLLLQIPDLEQRFDLSSIRLCVSAGEPLPRPVYDEWVQRTGIEVLDGLGTTEMFHIFISPRPDARKPWSTGKAVPRYEVRIVDDQLNEVPRGTAGLLAVRGPTGCRDWRKPERQREYVRGSWNVPNDACVQDEEGFVWYQCRNDDLIICAGYNIAGPEVEAVLLEHPSVLEAAVVASSDRVKGQVPKAFVVVRPGATAGPDLATDLKEHAKRELAPYKVPRKVEFVETLPKTETGKIRRVVLRRREFEQAG